MPDGAVWCGFCGGQSSPTPYWEETPSGGQRVIKSDISWYPRLNCHAHQACAAKACTQAENLTGVGGAGLRLAELADEGAETCECIICRRLDEVEVTIEGNRQVLLFDQTTQLHKHKTLGYIHASCVWRMMEVCRHVGLPTAKLAKTVGLYTVPTAKRQRILRHLPHWTPTIARFFGEHIFWKDRDNV